MSYLSPYGPYAPGPYVTGWILTLFPYVQNGEESTQQNPYLTTWQIEDPSSYEVSKFGSQGGSSVGIIFPQVLCCVYSIHLGRSLSRDEVQICTDNDNETSLSMIDNVCSTIIQ